MTPSVTIRPVVASDLPAWLPLWAGYNAFYGREGATALPEAITLATWRHFFNPDEPVWGLVAEDAGQLVGIVNFLYHRSTTRLQPVCYLQDLFTAPSARGQGIGRALIQGVYARARADGVQRVYWQTHVTNVAGRLLYDQLAQHVGFIVYAHDV